MLRLEARNSRGPDRAQAAVDQDPAAHRARVHRAEEPGPQRGPAHGLRGGRAARTSSSAGRTARPPSSSAATSAPGGATSARSTPASRSRWTTDEPRRVAESVATMGLRYATVTGVARDDLADGGAWLYAQTAPRDPRRRARLRRGAADPRLQRRAAAGWRRSSAPGRRCSRTTSRPCRGSSGGSGRASGTRGRWRCCSAAREAGLVTKSNLILGLGEERHEITEAMADLRAAGCDLLTITQYLRPSPRHHPVERWVKPEEFVELREEAAGARASPA